MTIHLGPVTFDRVFYDRDADVLYLNVQGAEPAHWEESPQGHVLRYDADGNLCGVTLIDVKHLLDAEGDVRVTLPRLEHLGREDLGMALAGSR